MTNEGLLNRKVLDVSKLPATRFDEKSTLWWGNNWGLAIETAVFGILVAMYFSVRMSISAWLPPRTTPGLPVLHNPLPDVVFPTIVLTVFLVSLAPGIYLDLAARKRDATAVKTGLVVTLSFNVALLILRYFEYDALQFKWNDNAYGSATWTILGMHMIHLFVMAGEDSYLLLWSFVKGVDEKHCLDVTVAAVYWYWIVGTWIFLYLLVFWGPRIL
jgi:heme/copper-type cytochrome/quinol oxidase subunit 3